VGTGAIYVFITEARLVCVSPSVEAPRTATAGQLRYPWVRMLEFQTKQNWLTDEVLRLFYEDPEGLQILNVTLDKANSAAALAPFFSVQRIGSYHLAASSPKDQPVIQQLENLRATQQLPIPEKTLARTRSASSNSGGLTRTHRERLPISPISGAMNRRDRQVRWPESRRTRRRRGGQRDRDARRRDPGRSIAPHSRSE
jgi:hypothetical protein